VPLSCVQGHRHPPTAATSRCRSRRCRVRERHDRLRARNPDGDTSKYRAQIGDRVARRWPNATTARPATYNLTKLLNVLFTYELARRWPGTSVTANALHPGWPLKTNLGREQTGPGAVFDRATKLIGSSAAKGARASLYLAGSPDVTAVTGQYFARCRRAKSSALTHSATPPNSFGHTARNSAVCRRRKGNPHHDTNEYRRASPTRSGMDPPNPAWAAQRSVKASLAPRADGARMYSDSRRPPVARRPGAFTSRCWGA